MVNLNSISLLIAQASDPTKTPSPEALKALTELLRTLVAHPSKDPELFSPERLTAIATLISSVAWPTVALVVLLAFKPQLEKIAGRVTEFKIFGVEGKIDRELKSAAEDAIRLDGKSGSPTGEELARAAKIDELASPAETDFIKKRAFQLAADYEKIRATQPSGDPRTRAMEAVVSQMRTIGRAVSSFRYELASSPSPGRRLQAIASLEVQPDYDLIGWLADRVREEKPFVAYHALVALNVAARGENARDSVDYLRLVADRLTDANLPLDSDRRAQLHEFSAQVARLVEGKPI